MKYYKNRDWLYKMYVENDLSQKSIGKLCEVNQSIIHHWLVWFDIPRRKFCSRKGHGSQYKGGRVRTTKGYIHILSYNHPNKNSRNYVPEQILVVEKYLGRILNGNEAIHHINGIKDDNRIENLYLFQSESEHQRYHRNFKFQKIPTKQITKSNLL